MAVLSCGCFDRASNSGVLGSVIVVAVVIVLREKKLKNTAGFDASSGERGGMRGKNPDLDRTNFMLGVCGLSIVCQPLYR